MMHEIMFKEHLMGEYFLNSCMKWDQDHLHDDLNSEIIHAIIKWTHFSITVTNEKISHA